MSEKICLGIDPGLASCGWAVVSRSPGDGKLSVVDHGCIKTKSTDVEGLRLLDIYKSVSVLIAAHHPFLVSIEDIYFNKNTTSCIPVAGVVGVCKLAAAQSGIFVEMIRPQAAKAAIGSATAKKAKVQQMLEKLTGVSMKNAHAADAAAIAIAGLLKHKG